MKNLVKLLLAFLMVLLCSCNSLSYGEYEYYEYRVYNVKSAAKQQDVLSFLRKAYVPALYRMGLNRIGVFTNARNNTDYNVYMVVPFAGMSQYSGRSQYLRNDRNFQLAAESFYSFSKDNPPYERIDSSFFKAFSSMPFMELPQESIEREARLFELRVYESHNEQAAALKRDMFNVDQETQLMRDLDMGPVFFGESLSGSNHPNLTYMLSAKDLQENKAYWQRFLNSPRWAQLKKIEKYKGTVSRIEKLYLKPVSFSGI